MESRNQEAAILKPEANTLLHYDLLKFILHDCLDSSDWPSVSTRYEHGNKKGFRSIFGLCRSSVASCVSVRSLLPNAQDNGKISIPRSKARWVCRRRFSWDQGITIFLIDCHWQPTLDWWFSPGKKLTALLIVQHSCRIGLKWHVQSGLCHVLCEDKIEFIHYLLTG
jgi:hypothetical protein